MGNQSHPQHKNCGGSIVIHPTELFVPTLPAERKAS